MTETSLKELEKYELNGKYKDFKVQQAYYSDKISLFNQKSPLVDALQKQKAMNCDNLFVRSHEFQPAIDPKNPSEYLSGKRQYFLCSHRQYFTCVKAMIPHYRNCYEMVQENCPCNGYIDIDKAHTSAEINNSDNLDKNVDNAFAELLICMEDLIKSKSVTDKDWQFDFCDVRINTSISDSNKKQSRHIVFHFPDDRMFNSLEDAGRFFKDCVEYSVIRNNGGGGGGGEEERDQMKSPIFYKTMVTDRTVGKDGDKIESVESMIDRSVYNKNRNMRSIMNCKSFDVKNMPQKPFLIPKCNHIDPPHTSLADCPYSQITEKLENIPESLFMANSIMFIPLNKATGEPVPIKKLQWPTSLFDLDKEKNARKSAMVGQKRLKLSDGKNEKEMEYETQFEENEELREIHRKLRNHLANSISDKIGPLYPFDGVKSIHDDGSNFSLVYRGYRSCPYDKNKGSHKSNHVFFNALLSYPYPVVFIKCLDEECKARNEKMGEVLEISKYKDEIKQTMEELIENTYF